jgi:phage-related protein
VGEQREKPLAWLHGEIKTPPFSKAARIEVGALLGRLQQGESLGLPHSRPMPSIGRGGHELRITDRGHQWRIVYRVDDDAIVIGDVFAKTSRTTPRGVIERCHKRLDAYDRAARERKKR